MTPTVTPLPAVTPAPQRGVQQPSAGNQAAKSDAAEERAQAKAARRAEFETDGHYTDGDRVTVAMNLSAGLKDTGGGFQATGTTLLFVNLTGDGTESDCTKQGLRQLLTLAAGEFLAGVRRAGFEKLGCYPNGPYIDVP